jgi:hypothetical protein
MSYKEQIYKQASINALRKKQYWQILKRMYGGTDEAVNAIKSSKDVGVYHGSKAKAEDLINSKILPATERNVFGKGAYLGSRESASKYIGEGGSLTRLKRPSELKGKEVYPKITGVSNSDIRVNPKVADKDLRKLQTFGPGHDDKTFYKEYTKRHSGGENLLPIGWDNAKYKNKALLDKALYTKSLDKLKADPGRKSIINDFAKMEGVSLKQKLKNDVEAMNPKGIQAPTEEARVIFRRGVPGNLLKDTVEKEKPKATVWDKLKSIWPAKKS